MPRPYPRRARGGNAFDALPVGRYPSGCMKSKIDMRAELLPLFLIVLGYALGFIFYGQQLGPLAKTGEEKYGPEWATVFGCVQWIIPSAALGVYLALSLAVWGIRKVKNPLSDWNALMKALKRAPVDDLEARERFRGRMIRLLFLAKVILALVALVAQWRFYQGISEQLGLALA